jgi:CxxC motif-containing protein (DUF1111 family)
MVAHAILQHRGTNSEANPSIDAFDALDANDQQSLVAFVSGL